VDPEVGIVRLQRLVVVTAPPVRAGR